MFHSHNKGLGFSRPIYNSLTVQATVFSFMCPEPNRIYKVCKTDKSRLSVKLWDPINDKLLQNAAHVYTCQLSQRNQGDQMTKFTLLVN